MQGSVKGNPENGVLRKEASPCFAPAVFMLQKPQVGGRTSGRGAPAERMPLVPVPGEVTCGGVCSRTDHWEGHVFMVCSLQVRGRKACGQNQQKVLNEGMG